MDYNKIIKQIFLVHDKRGWDKLESNKINIILNNKDKYINIYNYIIYRYNDYNNIYNLNNKKDIKTLFRESLIRIIHNINIRPVCKCCSKLVHFNGKTKLNYYNKYCSCFCSNKCTFNKESIINQYKYNLEHYGVKTNFEVNKCKEKRLETINNKYGNNAFKLFYNKCKETCIKKYGVESPMQLDYIKEKLNNTKRKNNTFNVSKPENKCYKLLCNKYGSDNIIRQYKSDLYPYNCDFYVKDKDLYIECNFHWTHNNHLYDKNNIKDIITKCKWKNKNTKFYNNAIKTWTERDVIKYKTAKINNLNYLVFYNIKELNDWINK